MKKVAAVITIFVLALSLVACGGSSTSTQPQSTSSAQSQKVEQTAAAAKAEYTAIPAVKSFIANSTGKIQNVYDAAVAYEEAKITKDNTKIVTSNTTLLKTATELMTLCTDFMATKNVPEKMQPAHRKLFSAASYICDFAESMVDGHYAQATTALDQASSLIDEGTTLMLQAS